MVKTSEREERAERAEERRRNRKVERESERKRDRTPALLQERLVQLLIDRKRPTRRWF